MPRKQLHFLLKQDHCAEGKLNFQKERAELGCVGHQRPSCEKVRRFQGLGPAAGFVYVSVLKSDEIKLIALLSTTETFLETPYIYDTEDKVIAEQHEAIITVYLQGFFLL